MDSCERRSSVSSDVLANLQDEYVARQKKSEAQQEELSQIIDALGYIPTSHWMTLLELSKNPAIFRDFPQAAAPIQRQAWHELCQGNAARSWD